MNADKKKLIGGRKQVFHSLAGTEVSVESIYIIGAGGHGRELNSYFSDLVRSGWSGRVAGFLDDGLSPGVHQGLRVLGSVEALVDELRSTLPDFAQAESLCHLLDAHNAGPNGRLCAPAFNFALPCAVSEKIVHLDALYMTALGDNRLRREMVGRIESLYGDRLRPFTLVHPSAMVGCGSEIGGGTCVAPGSIVTANTRIGKHVIVNVKASVAHDCEIGDFANINPGATVCGWVKACEGAFIGAGAVIKDRISIGPWSIVGAGAVVIRDVPAHATVAGVPARIIRREGE